MSLINNLAKMSILTEAPNDDLFDIDKEVDAQIKRVENRIARKAAQEEQTPEPNSTDNQQTSQSEDDQSQDNNPPEETSIDVQNSDDIDQYQQSQEGDNPEEGQSDDYEYMDGAEDIPDDYEPKQTIPELRILTTLSDKEYQLCNINIIKDFQELKRNVDSTLTNLIPAVTTKNIRQRQAVNIVKNNLYKMLDDIDNYIMYRNNDIYEENVTAYLTFLKRYQIATNIIKVIVEENLKYDRKQNVN